MPKTPKKDHDGPGPLASLDLSPKLDRDAYETALGPLQDRLARLQQAYLLGGHSAAIVFEGWDAAGKGGTIRRISAALDPRGFKVWPISAPRRYDLERHYLARFWERLPPKGGISIFDRSWYGRVLVERVEQLTPPERWRAAYREIEEFENQLTSDGMRVLKFFFHISRKEQLKRFEKRLRDPMKRWKLTYEDFRNRGRWADYETAIDEMLEQTSSATSPWHVIPANDKKHARIAAITRILEHLEPGVDLSPPEMDPRVIEAARREFDLPEAVIDGLIGETPARNA